MNKDDMKKKEERFLDVLCFVVGPCITVFSLLCIETHRRGGGGGYYYPTESKLGIIVGVALICFGLLRWHWKKKQDSHSPQQNRKNKE